MLYRLTTKDGAKTVEEVELSHLDAAGWTEKDFEQILSEQIELVIRENQLMVIAQERAWQEEADLLALDEAGTLYIFELKRNAGERSNLLQVIRYGQIFGRYDYEGLQYIFRRYTGRENLQEEHKVYFELEEPLPTAAFNRQQQFLVVTAGKDRETLDAVEYWKGKGLPISSLTYHVYKIAGEYVIEFHSYGPGTADYRGLLSGYYVVNTCRTYIPNAYLDMLRHSKAAAYGDRAYAVNRIQHGDKVYLYHNAAGVIAVGRAKGKTRDGEFEGTAERYINLDLEYAVSEADLWQQAVRAAEINNALGTSYRFRQTVFSITKKDAEVIDALVAKKMPKGTRKVS